MIAYKFLRRDGCGIFSGFAWPAPGEWVEAVAVECESGVHACRVGDLPYWVARSLWEVELDGEVLEGRTKVVASRGRLVRRIEAWDDEARDAYVDMCAVRPGDLLVAEVYEALRASADVWKRTLLVVTFDEHGGFFDHVAPPKAVNPDGVNQDANPKHGVPAFKFDRLGLRT